ncbi:MAG: hypothetical protein QXZ19_04175, partial [Thermoplasmata archaeon]
MFGKKLSKGFLVDANRILVKEFIFAPKAEGDFEQTVAAAREQGTLDRGGEFKLGKLTGYVIKGDKLSFITVGKDVPDESDASVVRELLSSVEKTLDAALDAKLKALEEAEQRAKAEIEAAKKANDELNMNRNDLALEGVALEELRMELDRLRQETDKWQEELKEFENQVNSRHAQISERVALLLEREQMLLKNQQAFEAAS